jgi:hypothetical protein
MSTAADPRIVPAWVADNLFSEGAPMYGYDPHSPRYDDLRYDEEPVERLRLMAFVDGRLVGAWTERVEESPWADVARRFDRERQRAIAPPPPPPVPTYERVLAYLDDVCGDREELLALSPTVLEDEPDLPEVDTTQARARLTAVAELLDAVAASSFDREIAVAFRRCLVAVWDKEPEVVLDAVTAAHVAGGVAWVVAKANGVLGAQGRVTVTQLKHALALGPSPSTYGKVVQRALVGYRDFTSERTGRSYELPDLLPLGRTDVLLGTTRRTLCRARDRALEARGDVTRTEIESAR